MAGKEIDVSAAPVRIAVTATKLETIERELGDGALGDGIDVVPFAAAVGSPLPDGDVEVLLHWGISTERLAECRAMTALRWVHTFWAGTERIAPVAQGLPGPPRFSDSRGTYEIPVAEHVLGLGLGLARGLHRLRDQQREQRWQPNEAAELHGRRALILGAGSIGARVGRLLAAFDVEVRGVRRDVAAAVGFPLFAPDALDALLAETDLLVAALPETVGTIGLLDGPRLRRLAPGAIVINVGRGSLIDEAALAELLADGTIAGCALDVFGEEPLPASSPLWGIENLWISPHCSGLSPAMLRRRVELFRANIAAYREGLRLVNEVRW